MSLLASGGPYRNDLYTSITTRQALLTSINTSLVAAQWTSTNVFSFSELVWTGIPSNLDTVTISGQVYTFKTGPVTTIANDVLIGTTASTSLQNLYNAINVAAGSGTLYGSATVINPFITAADFRATATTSGRFRVQIKINTTPFTLQNTQSFSKVSANLNFTFSQNNLAGYIWTSPQSPFGQQLRIYGLDAIESFVYSYVRLNVMDESELYRSTDFTSGSQATNPNVGFRLSLQYSAWRIIASRYHLAIYADSAGVPTGGASCFYAGVPYIYSFLRAEVISDASNTNPIICATGAPHNYITGDTITNRGITGNTNANGIFNVTVITPSTYSIPVAGNGNTLSSGFTSKTTGGNVSMAFFCSGDETGGLAFPYSSLTMSGTYCYQNINGIGFYNSGADGSGCMSVMISSPSRTQDAGTPMLFANGQAVIDEPHICLGGVLSTKALWVGQLYDCYTTLKQNTLAQAATVDSRNWWGMGGAAGSTTRAQGSLFFALS